MNATTIISDEMTLAEKLAAIDAMVQQKQEEHQTMMSGSKITAPYDPADDTMCEGCQ